ncbi:hypothetical protein EIP86_010807 [Pleurotus ostreatoroseus]|nr:hypothetical protein EIP86_010807 [Pleurotus ostreatoroseus]
MSSDVSVGVQSKISAFEALVSSPKPANSSASKSAPSLLDTPLSPSAKAYFPITPTSPASPSKYIASSPSPKSPALTRKASIDLRDWVVEDGPAPYVPRHRKSLGTKPVANGIGSVVRHASEPVVRSSTVSQPPPLIQFESPPNPAPAPPLPPRKASYSSLKSVSVSNSSSSSLQRSPNGPPIPLPPTQMRKKSDSLTVDHSYPPLGKLGISIPSRGNGPGHTQASSISSFHSVSLSSDGGTDPMTPGSLSNFVATYPVDRSHQDTQSNHEPDNVSLDESFENVSASSVISPTVSTVSNDWGELVRRPEPPKLPQRPRTTPTTLPASTSTFTSSRSANTTPVVPYIVRPQPVKPTPPPPPSRVRPPSSNRSSLVSTASDRSSVMSVATSRTSVSSGRPMFPVKPLIMQGPLARAAPIPQAARRRYEAVFAGNVSAQRRAREGTLSPSGRKRQAAGWRGLSVDLITNPDENPIARPGAPKPEEIGPDERLDGRTVSLIWKKSKLDRAKLKDIWDECDSGGIGSLNRDAFVKGMWRIDEELRKAQLSVIRGSPGLRQPKRAVTLLR